MKNQKYQIFISYRRDGGWELAQLIRDRLEKVGYRVFLDVESLRSGKFNEKLLEVIAECRDFIIILPPGGLDRCNDPEDWVRREAAHALACGKNIVPIMMRGFSFPETLPDEIAELRHYNGLEANQEFFDAVMEKLQRKFLKSRSVVWKRKVCAAAACLILAAAAGGAAWFTLGPGGNSNANRNINEGGYGPYDRTLYSMSTNADHVTFNSAVDNNTEIGDERYFVSASKYTGDASKNYWTDQTVAEDGQEYVIRMYVHNNADPALNLVSQDTRAYVILPMEAGTELHVTGEIYAANADPERVWDSTGFFSADGSEFVLQYVEGSATYYTRLADEEIQAYDMNMDSSVMSLHLFQKEGAAIGYDGLNGMIPGGEEYAGYLTFHVIARY